MAGSSIGGIDGSPSLTYNSRPIHHITITCLRVNNYSAYNVIIKCYRTNIYLYNIYNIYIYIYYIYMYIYIYIYIYIIDIIYMCIYIYILYIYIIYIRIFVHNLKPHCIFYTPHYSDIDNTINVSYVHASASSIAVA